MALSLRFPSIGIWPEVSRQLRVTKLVWLNHGVPGLGQNLHLYCIFVLFEIKSVVSVQLFFDILKAKIVRLVIEPCFLCSLSHFWAAKSSGKNLQKGPFWQVLTMQLI